MILNILLTFYSAILTPVNSIVLVLVQQPANIADEFSDPEQAKLIVILVIVFAFVAIFGLTFVVRSYR